jgi:hypothetical protein
MGFCPPDADDATQQVFMIASTKLDRITPSRERAYLSLPETHLNCNHAASRT